MKPFKLDSEQRTESGFKIPENYFENFQASVFEKIAQEPVAKETKVVSIFRKRKTIITAIAAVLVFALMIPFLLQSDDKNIDILTIENYLAEEGRISQIDLIENNESKKTIILDTKEIEIQALEDMLVSNPNIENLVIENQN